ncbi:hypothetical protein SAMN05216352_104242 [Alteribacillus bidgolensis]|uniref:Uncharacterized protein n=1 Tax=Alteribacillus bidgolensis TaxID=930129 RepID=A0A1G8HG20_9BACI|nr:hypothetical protein SAMN05216352_104242 [Alteribacillus bidgolensis]
MFIRKTWLAAEFLWRKSSFCLYFVPLTKLNIPKAEQKITLSVQEPEREVFLILIQREKMKKGRPFSGGHPCFFVPLLKEYNKSQFYH